MKSEKFATAHLKRAKKTTAAANFSLFTITFYFSGTSSSVFFSSVQKGSTVLMSARSVVV